MRVIVCGGRDYDDKDFLFSVLDRLHRDHEELSIAQGGAKGADSLARQWATDRRVPCLTFHANWDKYGISAGPRRNVDMANEFKPDMVVAFPGGRGTDHMVGVAKDKRVPVYDLRKIETDEQQRSE